MCIHKNRSASFRSIITWKLDAMKGKRDCLRVWLEKNLNANKIPGLQWKDKSAKIFKICWKHASKQGWSSEVDGCVFREWAIYSGKFKPGKSKEEPKVWKANFRCALNALPDIKELLEERKTRGNGAQKIFQLKPRYSNQTRRARGSRYVNAATPYKASACYKKGLQDDHISQVNGSVWTCSSIYNTGIWSATPVPLIQQMRNGQYYFEPDNGYLYRTRTSGNESVLSEEKIIELIDSWSNELKEKHDFRLAVPRKPSNFRHTDISSDFQYSDQRNDPLLLHALSPQEQFRY